MTAVVVFKACVEAMRQGALIERVSPTDKEFHFQNWFQARLRKTCLNFEVGGRNSYPDFRMVKTTDGFEIKGLAYPGRDASFDSNSQVPSGHHNGRTVYDVFGRYPKTPDGKSYPVLDLVLCHGDFLNADHEYRHENKSVKGFGSYGDQRACAENRRSIANASRRPSMSSRKASARRFAGSIVRSILAAENATCFIISG